MANAYKVLGQFVNSAINTLETLYTVPASTSTVASTLTVCNRGTSAASFRIAIRPAGAAIATKHYIVFDGAIAANDLLALTLGLTLATTDVVSVYSSSTNLTFNLYGTEIT